MAGPPRNRGKYDGELAAVDADTNRAYVWDARRSTWRLMSTESAVKFSTDAAAKQQKQNGEATIIEVVLGGVNVNGTFISTQQITNIAELLGLNTVGATGAKGKAGITPRVVVKQFTTNFMTTPVVIPKSDAIAVLGVFFTGGLDPPSIIYPNEATLEVKDTGATWEVSSTSYGASGGNIYCLSLN